MTADTTASAYHYGSRELGHHHSYLLPAVLKGLDLDAGGRIFDLGCGNGSTAAFLQQRGFDVTGVDPSLDGIAAGHAAHPGLKLEVGSCYEPLAERYGMFPRVVSLEVIEHIYAPRDFARTLFELVEPGGKAIVSTPYHSYLKNLALAVSGKMDAHFTTLWDHGHIKFWSIPTLSQLLEEAGFRDITFRRVGRIPALAKSMVAIARKPSGDHRTSRSEAGNG